MADCKKAQPPPMTPFHLTNGESEAQRCYTTYPVAQLKCVEAGFEPRTVAFTTAVPSPFPGWAMGYLESVRVDA